MEIVLVVLAPAGIRAQAPTKVVAAANLRVLSMSRSPFWVALDRLNASKDVRGFYATGGLKPAIKIAVTVPALLLTEMAKAKSSNIVVQVRLGPALAL
jgi:hypothetical protein